MISFLLKKAFWCRFGIFFVNFEHISHPVLVFLLLTLNLWTSNCCLGMDVIIFYDGAYCDYFDTFFFLGVEMNVQFTIERKLNVHSICFLYLRGLFFLEFLNKLTFYKFKTLNENWTNPARNMTLFF